MGSPLPDPECRWGYTREQVTAIFGAAEPGFWEWMVGQTQMLCDGRSFNYDTMEYEPSGCDRPHGEIVYAHDLRRYLMGLPALD